MILREVIDMKIGDKIMYQRRLQKLTQADLADRIGVTSKTLGHWEHGKYIPKAEDINNIAQALNIPITELLDNSEPSSPQTEPEADQETKLIYEWGGNHRVVLPNTPETRELFREIMLSAIPRDAAPAVPV